jgi:NADH-quinone oxidoreductase subunit M
VILLVMLVVPLLGGILAWLSERVGPELPRRVNIVALVVDFLVIVYLWLVYPPATGTWIVELNHPWVPNLGIDFHLALDGFSLILTGLTVFLGVITIAGSSGEVRDRVGLYHLVIAMTITGILGVFTAVDLFLFYFAWELMLVPMFFLIALWGHEDRFKASVKFFIFTQLSGLFMLVSILGLYVIHGRSTGSYTFDYGALMGSSPGGTTGVLLLLGFLAAFLVKLPAVPFHTWLPDAHTQAPTAGSVLLAGLLLKTGAYGIVRFALPLFPQAMADVSGVISGLAVVGILYGAILAFGQNDIKRLVAYTSVSHMGFVLLGIVTGGGMAFKGAVIEIVAHALSTGGLFLVAGILQTRLATRDLGGMGGLWSQTPRLGGITMVFALASLGLPGLGNFVGEFLILLGTYRVNPYLAIAAALGFVFSTVYALRLIHRVFFGERGSNAVVLDLSARELTVMVLMIIPLLWLGLYPQWFLDSAGKNYSTVHHVIQDRGQR